MLECVERRSAKFGRGSQVYLIVGHLPLGIANRAQGSARIYSAGRGINLLTKYGLFSLRYYEEFGANATPSGRQLMFSVTIGKSPKS